jgi:putative ABC transport system permease protein
MARLSIGLACCLSIMGFVKYELSYDRMHPHAEQIYRITAKMTMSKGEIPIPPPGPLGPPLVRDLPGVVRATRIRYSNAPINVQFGSERFSEPGLCYTESGLFEMFDFSLKSGTPGTAFSKPYSLVLSSSLAQKYFGDENQIGKPVALNGKPGYTVTGVLNPLPDNTHLQFGLVVSYVTLEMLNPVVALWAEGAALPYVELAPGYSAESLQSYLDEKLDRYMGGFAQDLKTELEYLPDIYLYSAYPPGLFERRGHCPISMCFLRLQSSC